MTVSSLEQVRAARPEAGEFNPYYATYIGKIGDGDIVRTLAGQVGESIALIESIPEARAGHRYAAGKWSIRELVGHVCDAERIFTYRALCFARGDATPLPAFDENAYVARSRLDDRSLAGLADELDAVRRATVALFDSLFPEELLRRGVANENPMSVRALAWIIAGHERHHMEVLRGRYL